MSLILHLSDLHLGSPTERRRDYDDKVGGQAGTGMTDADHLTRTLTALGRALTKEGRVLDAVVVSGDLTIGNHPDGYQQFDALLQELGGALPTSDRIVVVPGNHDVDSRVEPGDPRKLKRFLDATRIKYRVPLVKGLDYRDGELRRNPGRRGKPRPILDLDDAIVVSINSADYCWTEEQRTKTDWDALLADYSPSGTPSAVARKRKRAADELAKLRTHDIPKVDKLQLKALGRRLDEVDVTADADADRRLRIAVLHHPIGIASRQEEIKPFEVITNLAELRTFLYHRGFHLVLHGHKHQSYASWDWLVPPRDDPETVPRRVLVLGASGQFRVDEPACRLIEVSPGSERPVAGAPRLRVIDVEGVEQSEELRLGQDAPIRSLAQPFMTAVDQDTPWVVKARTADAAYQQLHDLRADRGANRPVISVVEDPASASKLPTNYAKSDGMPPLAHMVGWWQHPRPEAIHSYSGPAFNHGERLYREGDAIADAVGALPSSKAIALLVAPDEAGNSDREFPAFTQVQLQERQAADGRQTFLDVVGVFRKQDLDYWWPVNMAELREIQQNAIDVAKERDHSVDFQPGRLIAMTSIGVHENVLPQMAGTAIDRAVDLRPEWLYKLAYLAAHPGSDTEREWQTAMEDIGDREGNGLLVPSVGITRLREAMRMHLGNDGVSATFRRLTREVEGLAEKAAWADAALRGQKEPSVDELNSRSRELKTQADSVLKALRQVVVKGRKEGMTK